jgi:fused signal recognition particle receptor
MPLPALAPGRLPADAAPEPEADPEDPAPAALPDDPAPEAGGADAPDEPAPDVALPDPAVAPVDPLPDPAVAPVDPLERIARARMKPPALADPLTEPLAPVVLPAPDVPVARSPAAPDALAIAPARCKQPVTVMA